MKKCTICKEDKGFSCFNKNKTRKDGYNNICRICSNTRSKRYYNVHGEKHKQNVKTRNINTRVILRQNMLTLLKNKECEDCKIKDIRVLEFDHLHNKEYDISKMMSNLSSWDKILQEIEKCEIVCCNCHRIRTITRSNNYRNVPITQW